MLSSRYLHLHEALGLGPMWLNQNAQVRAGERRTAAPVRPTAPQSHTTPLAQAVRSLSPTAHQARMSAIAVLDNKKTTIPNAPAQTETAKAQTPVSPEPLVQNPLSDGILPQLHAQAMPSEIMVVSLCPSPEDGMRGKLFSGSVGTLLDNMLAAIGLKPEQVHKTSWVKTAAVSNVLPTDEQITQALPPLHQELSDTQAKAVLFLGLNFSKPEHTAQASQLCPNTPYFIVPHPAQLLRQPQLKAQAWQELKKLKRLLGN